jgi:lysophospholipase L1-like esterase
VSTQNLGVSGETVQGLFARLESHLDHIIPPHLILIMSGINNVAMEDFTFPVFYEKIIELFAQTFPQAKIAVNSLLPAQLPWLESDTVPRMNLLLRQMAERSGVLFMDIYSHFITNKKRQHEHYFLNDGVHLSDTGYRVWAEAINASLTETGTAP